jgi:hypothetical protein
LTYTCTIRAEERGATTWTGTAFDCSGNEIVLIHTFFSYPYREVAGECNNGAIVARSLSAEGNNYTSQLNVIVTPEIVGKSIECRYDHGILQLLSIISITGSSSFVY